MSQQDDLAVKVLAAGLMGLPWSELERGLNAPARFIEDFSRDYLSQWDLISGPLPQGLHHSMSANERLEYHAAWCELSEIVGALTNQVAPATGYSSKGSIFTRCLADTVIMGGDREARGYVGAGDDARDELRANENVVRAIRSADSNHARMNCISRIVNRLQDLSGLTAAPDALRGHVHDPEIDRIKDECAQLEAHDRELKTRYRSGENRKAFIRAYEEILDSAARDVVSFSIDPWKPYELGGTQAEIGRDVFSDLKKAHALPHMHRFLFNVAATTFSKAYVNYVVHREDITITDKREMIEALREMLEHLQAMESKLASTGHVAFVIVSTLVVTADAEGNLRQYRRAIATNASVEQYRDECQIAKNQLEAPNADALANLPHEDIYASLGYAVGAPTEAFLIRNPFDFNVEYILPTFPFGAHEAEQIRLEFLELSTSKCEEGECITAALQYREPHPTNEELNAIIALCGDPKVLTADKLAPIKSSEWILVKQPTDDHSWTVEGASSEALKKKSPAAISLKSVIVLCHHGDHMYRVTKIFMPDRICIATEHLATEGILTLIVPDYNDMNKLYPLLEYNDGHAGFGVFAMAELRAHPQKTIIQVMKTLSSGVFIRTVLKTYSNQTKEWLPYDDKVTKDPMHPHRELLEIPVVLLVEPHKSAESWNVLAASCKGCNKVTPQDVFANQAKFIVLVKHKQEYMRVIDYNMTIDGVYYSAREMYAVGKGSSLAATVTEANKDLQLISPEECEAVQTEADLKSLTCAYSIIKGVKRAEMGGDEPIYEVCSDVEPQLRFWRDYDNSLYAIICESAYRLREIPLRVKQPPIFVAFDSETGTNGPETPTGLRAAKAGVDPITIHEVHQEEGGPIEGSFTEGHKCAWEFVKKLLEIKKKYDKKRDIIVIGFNSAVFDMYEILLVIAMMYGWAVGSKLHKTKFVKNGSKILELRVDNVVFHDVRRFVTGSLDAASNAFKCQKTKTCWDHLVTQKLYEDCEYDSEKFLAALKTLPAAKFMCPHFTSKMKPNDRAQEQARYEQAMADVANKDAYTAYHEYCHNDCEVTLQLYQVVRKSLLEVTNNELDINEHITIPEAVFSYSETIMKRTPMAVCSVDAFGHEHWADPEPVKPYLIKDPKEYAAVRHAMQAGQSRIYTTAPRGMTKLAVEEPDETSQYPHAGEEGWFIPDTAQPFHHEKIDKVIPNQLGIYRVTITKQASPVVIPLKSSDSIVNKNGLGAHFWEYQGPFETWAWNISLRVHEHFGGEYTVHEAYTYSQKVRGMFGPALAMFKAMKLKQDTLKGTSEYNQALREICKLALNSLLGKFNQQPNLDQSYIIADDMQKKELEARVTKRYPTEVYEDELRIAGTKKQRVCHMPLYSKGQPTICEQLMAYNKPSLITVNRTMEDIFSKGYPTKSMVNGSLIYEWSRAHMTLGIIGYAWKAGACLSIETDGLIIDSKKYREYMRAQHADLNAYDLPAPCMEDPIFSATVPIGNTWSHNRPLGYFYCPGVAKEYNASYVKPREEEFGDYKMELTSRGKEVDCCFISKKCCYIDVVKDNDAFKATFKGIGQSSKPAAEYQARVEKLHEDYKTYMATPAKARKGEKPSLIDDAELRRLKDAALKGPSVLNRDLYEKLSDGYGVDACELRFQGALSQLQEAGYGLQSSLVCKRINPPEWRQLQIRVPSVTPDDKANTKYEMQYPNSVPRGTPSEATPAMITIDDHVVSPSDMKLITECVTKTKEYARGETIKLNGSNVYITEPTLRFIKRHNEYFKFERTTH